MVVLEGVAISYERGTPVGSWFRGLGSTWAVVWVRRGPRECCGELPGPGFRVWVEWLKVVWGSGLYLSMYIYIHIHICIYIYLLYIYIYIFL